MDYFKSPINSTLISIKNIGSKNNMKWLHDIKKRSLNTNSPQIYQFLNHGMLHLRCGTAKSLTT